MAAPRRRAGLGWSRICMLALKKCRIGEAQAAGGCGKRRKNAQGRTFSFWRLRKGALWMEARPLTRREVSWSSNWNLSNALFFTPVHCFHQNLLDHIAFHCSISPSVVRILFRQRFF